MNWQESDLAARLRSDPGTLAIAARLRSETTLPIKWIAALVQIGTPKGAQAVLNGVRPEVRTEVVSTLPSLELPGSRLRRGKC